MRRRDAAICQYGGRWRGRSSAVLVKAIVMASAMAASASASEPTSRQWAMIIAVKEYDKKGDSLPNTLNDARWLKSALTECGVPEGQILMITDDSPQERRPRLKNIQAELARFLGGGKIGPKDHMFVFFSGHGVARGEETYLKPSDFETEKFETDDPGQTALAVSKVLEALHACPARFKLLALDCCHAGGSKGSVVASSIASDCVVLASCEPDEESWDLPGQERGIFTYFLCRALEGEADEDADGRLSVDEVFRYTRTNTRNAAIARGKEQEPVCHGLPERSKEVLFASPQSPTAVWTRVARQFDKEIRERKLQWVLVPEFRQRTAGALSLLPAPYPAHCAIALAKTLQDQALDDEGLYRYEVKYREPSDDFPIDGRFDDVTVRKLRREFRKVDAVVLGTLQRYGRSLHVECELIRLSDHRKLAKLGAMIALDEERIVLMGASLDNRDRPSGASSSAQVVDHALGQARRDNPFARPAGAFPFGIEVWSIETPNEAEKIEDWTPRNRCEYLTLPPSQEDDAEVPRHHLLVAGPSGKRFEIRVWNNSPGRVGVKLLDNGTNTLGKTVDPRGQAWSWVLNPTRDPSKPFVFAGSYSAPDTLDNEPGMVESRLSNRFAFRRRDRPFWAPRRYGEPIDTITAEFYEEKQGKALAAGERPDAERRLGTKDFRAGALLGAVHICYVDERALPARQPSGLGR